eukprot:729567-Hanusia_phi.AAC.1
MRISSLRRILEYDDDVEALGYKQAPRCAGEPRSLGLCPALSCGRGVVALVTWAARMNVGEVP